MGNIQTLSIETGFLANIFEFLDDFYATTNDFDPTFLRHYHKDFYAIVVVSKWAKNQIILYLKKIRKINICYLPEEDCFENNIGYILKYDIFPCPDDLEKIMKNLPPERKNMLQKYFQDTQTHQKYYGITFKDLFLKLNLFLPNYFKNWLLPYELEGRIMENCTATEKMDKLFRIMRGFDKTLRKEKKHQQRMMQMHGFEFI